MLKRVTSWGLKEAMKNVKTTKKTLPISLANTIQNHFVEGFRLGGYRTDKSRSGWKDRQFTKGKGKRGTLISKGILRRDIKKRVTTFDWIIVGTSSLTDAYAQIHNQGGTIPITKKMRKFFWFKHFKSRSKAEKEYWKSLALHSGNKLKIPRREFIGDSRPLERKLLIQIDARLKNIFK